MLARLDTELAPLRAAVDRQGNYLRITGARAWHALSSRVTAIIESLGYVAQPLDGEAGVSRWFGASDIDELSQEEADVLAGRWVEQMKAESVVAEPERVHDALRGALLVTFRSAARSGVIHEPDLDPAALVAVVGERDAAIVKRWVDGKLGRLIDEPGDPSAI